MRVIDRRAFPVFEDYQPAYWRIFSGMNMCSVEGPPPFVSLPLWLILNITVRTSTQKTTGFLLFTILQCLYIWCSNQMHCNLYTTCSMCMWIYIYTHITHACVCKVQNSGVCRHVWKSVRSSNMDEHIKCDVWRSSSVFFFHLGA